MESFLLQTDARAHTILTKNRIRIPVILRKSRCISCYEYNGKNIFLLRFFLIDLTYSYSLVYIGLGPRLH